MKGTAARRTRMCINPVPPPRRRRRRFRARDTSCAPADRTRRERSPCRARSLQLPELVRRVVARHRRVGLGRTEVLPDRQDLAADVAQIPEGREQFVALFAETHHQSGLRRDVRRDAPRAIEQFQRARVTAAGARHAVQPRNCFRVVVQHVRPRVEHGRAVAPPRP